ncbi:MAG TPA: hypothetical protein PKC39_10065 [Ferruginibacter sp.]|nr:hypothetical protein [Ferruginibacter sp.]HMP21294.1 hypothetical protein [Ferruginibacter sp.]
MKKLAFTFFAIFICITGYTQLPAFPGAEGFGKYASGGRGGKVVAVTSLADAGVGTLRWALEQYIDTIYVYKDAANPQYPVTIYQPLTIVFNVSGTIFLKSDLRIRRDNLTIAGQTAPCGGICITGRSVIMNGATGGQLFYHGPRRKNVILRYLRFRPGIPLDNNGQPTDAFITYGLDVENYENIIIDHCSISWANEECMAIYDNKNTTVQWCIVSEGLYNAYHSKGLRGYGGVWGGQYASYFYNLTAHQNNRTPRFNGSRAHDTIALIDYNNNVNYNWGTSSSTYGGDVELNGGIARLNMFNNYYKPGPASPSTHKLMRPDYSGNARGVGRFHVSGNVIEGNAARTADNWLAVDFANIPVASRDSSRSDTAFSIAIPLQNLLPAPKAFDTVLQWAGAALPLRDAVDQRIVHETRTRTTSGTGSAGRPGIIDNPAVVGGLPDYETCNGPIDTDADGMPDEWETEYGLDRNNPEDRNLIANDGYTMLEHYLNGLTLNRSAKKICPGTNLLELTAELSGTSYQWEEDRGNGFAALSGQNTASLNIPVATSYYGYAYRCKVNGNAYTKTYMLKFEARWNGSADANWENPLNWDCNQVPDIFTDAYITSNQAIVTSNVSCRSLRVSPGAGVTVNTGYTIQVAH